MIKAGNKSDLKDKMNTAAVRRVSVTYWLLCFVNFAILNFNGKVTCVLKTKTQWNAGIIIVPKFTIMILIMLLNLIKNSCFSTLLVD